MVMHMRAFDRFHLDKCFIMWFWNTSKQKEESPFWEGGTIYTVKCPTLFKRGI